MTMLCHRWRMAITLDREPRRKVSGKDIPPTYYVRPGEPTPPKPQQTRGIGHTVPLALPLCYQAMINRAQPTDLELPWPLQDFTYISRSMYEKKKSSIFINYIDPTFKSKKQ